MGSTDKFLRHFDDGIRVIDSRGLELSHVEYQQLVTALNRRMREVRAIHRDNLRETAKVFFRDNADILVWDTSESAKKNKRPVVYFCWFESKPEIIKIGKSKNVARRMSELRQSYRERDCGDGFKLLATVYHPALDIMTLEGAYHSLFNDCRMGQGEWFCKSRVWHYLYGAINA